MNIQYVKDYLYDLLYYYPDEVKDEYDVHSEVFRALTNEYSEYMLNFEDSISIINFHGNYEGIHLIGYEWDIEIEDDICKYIIQNYPERFL